MTYMVGDKCYKSRDIVAQTHAWVSYMQLIPDKSPIFGSTVFVIFYPVENIKFTCGEMRLVELARDVMLP